MSPIHVEIPDISDKVFFYSQKYGRIIAYHVYMLLTETIYISAKIILAYPVHQFGLYLSMTF